jgi:phosphoribosylaminoimidazolecarboxamide formyltransferase/IMP cyclohydrolase
MSSKKIKRALISVADKANLIDLVKILAKHGVEILASDGTHAFLRENNLDSIKISDYTGFPEILDGRVKTLNPLIFAGILSKQDDASHLDDLSKVKAKPIDLVVVDLYHFDSNPSIEKIDIGGSALIRAAAKNFNDVSVLINKSDYQFLIDELENEGGVSLNLRRRLARKAFEFSYQYDFMIAKWFGSEENVDFEDLDMLTICLSEKSIKMRYGENPGQKAIFRNFGNENFGFKQICGEKELSFNNIFDAHSAIHLCYEFEYKPCIVIVKHNNPCCVALGETILEAYKKAISTDKESSFGGIVASNREIDAQTAKQIIDIFTEVVIAPKISPDAFEVFKSKKNLRVITFDSISDIRNSVDFKPALGGVLMQNADYSVNRGNWECVTEKRPSFEEFRDMEFAFKVSKHCKSNAIVFATNETAIAIGPGQTSRIQSTRIAIERLEILKDQVSNTPPKEIEDPNDLGSAMDCLSAYHNQFDTLVMASDGFLPFPDSLEIAAEAGIKSVIQPGGSINDKKVIEKANDLGISMIFTGQRVFKH